MDVYVQYGTFDIYAEREDYDDQHINSYPYKPKGNKITPYLSMLDKSVTCSGNCVVHIFNCDCAA